MFLFKLAEGFVMSVRLRSTGKYLVSLLAVWTLMVPKHLGVCIYHTQTSL